MDVVQRNATPAVAADEAVEGGPESSSSTDSPMCAIRARAAERQSAVAGSSRPPATATAESELQAICLLASLDEGSSTELAQAVRRADKLPLLLQLHAVEMRAWAWLSDVDDGRSNGGEPEASPNGEETAQHWSRAPNCLVTGIGRAASWPTTGSTSRPI